MLDALKRFTTKTGDTKNKDTSLSIDTTPGDSQKTVEQTTPQPEETQTNCFMENEFILNLNDAVLKAYPKTNNFSTRIRLDQSYTGNGNYRKTVNVFITWENGVQECRIRSIYDEIMGDHISKLAISVDRNSIRPYLYRMFSTEAILKACRKYADCIAPGLPINVHNIGCFKLGGVTLCDLAVGELRTLDEV